jgi:hypothetical protein
LEDVFHLLERARKAEEQRAAAQRERRLQQLRGAAALTLSAASKAKAASAELAESRPGRSFEFSNTGFFRHAAHTLRNELAWHCYAACRFLVFQDFQGSFDAFLEAFRWAPKNKPLKANFDLMLTHFHGPDKAVQEEVVKARMRKLAQEDADKEEARRVNRLLAQQRRSAASRIQVCLLAGLGLGYALTFCAAEVARRDRTEEILCREPEAASSSE